MPEIQRFFFENEDDKNQKISEIFIETLHGDMGIDYWNNAKWVFFKFYFRIKIKKTQEKNGEKC